MQLHFHPHVKVSTTFNKWNSEFFFTTAIVSFYYTIQIFQMTEAALYHAHTMNVRLKCLKKDLCYHCTDLNVQSGTLQLE